jgi:hypothetical protein
MHGEPTSALTSLRVERLAVRRSVDWLRGIDKLGQEPDVRLGSESVIPNCVGHVR